MKWTSDLKDAMPRRRLYVGDYCIPMKMLVMSLFFSAKAIAASAATGLHIVYKVYGTHWWSAGHSGKNAKSSPM